MHWSKTNIQTCALFLLVYFSVICYSLNQLTLSESGGYDPRLKDNVETLYQVVDYAKSIPLLYDIISPAPIPTIASRLVIGEPNLWILFILNFTMAQRTALLRDPTTLALLYTPANEHFSIVPVEAMACGLPVLACDSGSNWKCCLRSCRRTNGLAKNARSTSVGWCASGDCYLAFKPTRSYGEKS